MLQREVPHFIYRFLGCGSPTAWCRPLVEIEKGLNHIENEIGATESLSVSLAEVITARSININTDYLLSHVHKSPNEGRTVRNDRDRISHPELHEQVSILSLFFLIIIKKKKLLRFSQTHTQTLILTSGSLSATF